jgi:hypothetical protein
MTLNKTKMSWLLSFGVMTSGQLLAVDHALMNDAEIDERLTYLEQSIDEISAPYAYWQYGWGGLYAVSAASNFASALDEDDHDDEVLAWVSALKASAALTKMTLQPVPLLSISNASLVDSRSIIDDELTDGLLQKESTDNLRALKILRLQETEAKLEATALRRDERYQWKTHATTVGVNLIAAAMIATWGDSNDALESAALGISMGELAIWTQPTKASQKWQSYQAHFDDIEVQSVSWHLVPRVNGLDLIVNF